MGSAWVGGPPRPDWPGTRAVRKTARALGALSHHRSFLCYRQKARPESHSLAPTHYAWRALKTIPRGLTEAQAAPMSPEVYSSPGVLGH